MRQSKLACRSSINRLITLRNIRCLITDPVITVSIDALSYCSSTSWCVEANAVRNRLVTPGIMESCNSTTISVCRSPGHAHGIEQRVFRSLDIRQQEGALQPGKVGGELLYGADAPHL